MTNIRLNPGKGIAGNKPADAVDACYDLQGQLIYRGGDAWDGILDSQAAGLVHAEVPAVRHLAHRGRRADRGRRSTTAREDVEQAVADGTYGRWTPDAVRAGAAQGDLPRGGLRLQQAGPGAALTDAGPDGRRTGAA